jgi:hypothetical protein
MQIKIKDNKRLKTTPKKGTFADVFARRALISIEIA